MLGGKYLPLVYAIAHTLCSSTLLANNADHSGQDFAPSISPNGQHVAYYSYRGNAADLSDIYIVDIGSGVETQITNTPGIFEIEPKWSLDGSKIIFAGGPSMKELALYSVSIDGGEYQPFYSGPGSGPLVLSADGTRGLFWQEFEGGNSKLIIHDFKTGDHSTIETGLTGQHRSPKWLQGDHRILFSYQAVNQNGHPFDTRQPQDGVYQIELQTDSVTKLTQTPIAAYGQVVAPDGQIYFMAKNAEGVMHIQRIPLGGGQPEQVSPDNNSPAYFPAISEDGTTLYFSGRITPGKTRILSMPLSGGNAQQVVTTFVKNSDQ